MSEFCPTCQRYVGGACLKKACGMSWPDNEEHQVQTGGVVAVVQQQAEDFTSPRHRDLDQMTGST